MLTYIDNLAVNFNQPFLGGIQITCKVQGPLERTQTRIHYKIRYAILNKAIQLNLNDPPPI